MGARNAEGLSELSDGFATRTLQLVQRIGQAGIGGLQSTGEASAVDSMAQSCWHHRQLRLVLLLFGGVLPAAAAANLPRTTCRKAPDVSALQSPAKGVKSPVADLAVAIGPSLPSDISY